MDTFKCKGLELFDASMHSCSFVSGRCLGPLWRTYFGNSSNGTHYLDFPADTALGRFTHILVYTASLLVESTTPVSEQQ